MATSVDIDRAEQIIGYPFKDKGLIALALIAAGAEELNHDGNRKLALFGEQLLQFLISWSGFKNGATRGKVDLDHYLYRNGLDNVRPDEQQEECHREQEEARRGCEVLWHFGMY